MTIANYVFGFIPILRDYAIQFLLLYFFTALMGIMTSFARGIDRIADLSISGVLCTAIMIGFNVLFL
ncbi:MAG TPA: polysaccharide biosynthesis protein, partial [Clostridium sp.]|nr:polysaccharide biosynthesis protein [Clostridium sp.]